MSLGIGTCFAEMSSLGWKLSRPQFFDKFKTSTSDKDKKSSGNKPELLGYICDDTYFLWRCSTKTIIKAICSDIWRTDEVSAATYQEWSLSASIPFNVTNINVRKRAQEMCLLWGSSGIAVVSFPLKRISLDLVADSVILGERIYVEHPRLTIVQAKWHPTTNKDIVLVLNNDYYIRSYDLANPHSSFSVICAGPSSSIPFNYSQLSAGLSEPPVDFDFGPYLYDSDQWTVFLLKSSGTLSYLLMKIIESTKRCHWEAEKLISVDGVFEDVFELPTTLSVTNNFPTVVTIGSLCGKLYHSVLIPSDTEAHDVMNMEEAMIAGETTLYVKEVLELEPEANLSYVKLIPDPLCQYRYACVHEAGIHVITMNFVPYMLNLLAGKEEPTEVGTTSTCRYVLCCTDDSRRKNIFTCSTFSNSIPQKFVTITGSGETLVYDIPKYPLSIMDSTISSPEKGGPTSPNTSFALVVPELKALETVTSLLTKDTNQPYLSCTEDLSPEKREQILMDSFRTLEQEYIQKQERAIEFLNVTVSDLLEKVEELSEPLKKLVSLQPVLRGKAEEIAEKYEEQNDAGESFQKRLSKVLVLQQQTLPVMTDAEKVWLRKLELLKEEVGHMKEQVDGLKGKLSGETVGVSPSRETKQVRMVLSANELLKIKKEILEHQKDLAELAAAVHQIDANTAT